jgi:hypothetical protein
VHGSEDDLTQTSTLSSGFLSERLSSCGSLTWALTLRAQDVTIPLLGRRIWGINWQRGTRGPDMRQVGDMLVWLGVIVVLVAVIYLTPRFADYVIDGDGAPQFAKGNSASQRGRVGSHAAFH